MGFSSKEYWSGLPFVSPGHLPNPGMKLRSPEMQADALPSEPPGKPNGIYKSVSQFRHSVVSDSLKPMDCSMLGFSVHHQHQELA